MPRASARRKVRRFFANKRMLIVLAEEVGEISLQLYALWRRRIRSKESCLDVLEPFGVDAADHATGMSDGDRAALLGDDHRDGVADLRDPQGRAMAEPHLSFGGTVQDAACRKRHHARRGDDAPVCN